MNIYDRSTSLPKFGYLCARSSRSKMSASCQESVLPFAIFSNNTWSSRYTSIVMQNRGISNVDCLPWTPTRHCLGVFLKLILKVNFSPNRGSILVRHHRFRHFYGIHHGCHDSTPHASLGVGWSRNSSHCCSSPIVSIPLFFSSAAFEKRGTSRPHRSGT